MAKLIANVNASYTDVSVKIFSVKLQKRVNHFLFLTIIGLVGFFVRFSYRFSRKSLTRGPFPLNPITCSFQKILNTSLSSVYQRKTPYQGSSRISCTARSPLFCWLIAKNSAQVSRAAGMTCMRDRSMTDAFMSLMGYFFMGCLKGSFIRRTDLFLILRLLFNDGSI